MTRTVQTKRRDGAVLVIGATGFIGSALTAALVQRGESVIAATRRAVVGNGAALGPVTWRYCDVLRPESLQEAMTGVRVVYYLVHSMGRGRSDYAAIDRRSARNVVDAAERAGIERIIYLGGPVPPAKASAHLRSRAEVGAILRAGKVPTIELRASMVIGRGSASWQVVRDLAKRLPAMILPRWLESKTCPIALDDAIAALVAAADMPIAKSVAFDIPGPEVVSGREILERIARLEHRRVPILEVPLLTPRLSAAWLKLVTGADYGLARELVFGLTTDLLPESDNYWRLIGHEELVPFDEAARRALADEPRGARSLAGLEERLVKLTARRSRDEPPWAPRRGETP